MDQKKIVKSFLFIFSLLISNSLFSQSNFNPFRLFAAYPKSAVTEYRSANGAPGHAYWQNRVNYLIDASIDTNTNILTGKVQIAYTNNSPDALTSLWLQLDQNLYRRNSIGNFSRGRSANEFTNGYELKTVQISTGKTFENADYIVEGTRMQIRLKEPLASGKNMSFTIAYRYEVPGLFGGRTDVFSTENGKIYEIAQWYPRMCVYDDLNGWNTLPFIGTGEFYCEYGDFDYKVTVPEGMIVVGSGEVVNEQDIYSPAQLKRLALARKSDQTIFIRTRDEVISENTQWRNNRTGSVKTKTWHFKMQNSRDVAFGASTAYVLDAARINLPDDKKALAMSAYPTESAGEKVWARSTEYLKGSIEYFSKKWTPYPYPVAVNEAGNAGGMEYPGIVFDGMRAGGKTLFWVTAHEIGHTWFPMVVGSDERRNAWVDEGFNTFIDVYASDNFNKGEYAPKRDGEYAPGGGNPADEILPWIEDPKAPTMMNRADIVTGKYRHAFSYFKPAFGLILLREQILGPDRFDYAFTKYIKTWSYKHPSPDDFFRMMENEGGEDLSYFWRQWFQNNWLFDVAVDSLVANKNGKSSTVYLVNKEQSAYPLNVKIDYANGTTDSLRIPVEVWYNGPNYSFQINHHQPIQSVVIDPDNKLPDTNRKNNVWRKN